MKYFTVAVLAFSFAAFAGHHDHKKMKEEWKKLPFDQQKQMLTEKLDRKAAIVQDGRTCVNGAKTSDDLMKCKEDMWEDKKEMKAEMKSKMKDMKKTN